MHSKYKCDTQEQVEIKKLEQAKTKYPELVRLLSKEIAALQAIEKPTFDHELMESRHGTEQEVKDYYFFYHKFRISDGVHTVEDSRRMSSFVLQTLLPLLSVSSGGEEWLEKVTRFQQGLSRCVLLNRVAIVC